MTTEATVKKKGREWLQSKKIWRFPVIQNKYSRKGVADDCGCYKSRMFVIEYKAPHRRKEPNGGLTAWQIKEINNAKEAGALCIIAYDLSDIVNAFVTEMGMEA